MWEKLKYTPNIISQRKTKMRVVPVIKCDLPDEDSKCYWNNVVENIEAQVTRVRHPCSILFPSLSSVSPVKCSASHDDNVDYNLGDSNTQMKNVAKELIVRVSPPSPSNNKRVSDITPHNLRHVKHINYLKDRDISNCMLDFLHEKNSSEEIRKNKQHEQIIEIEPMENHSKMDHTLLDHNFPSLNKIAQLSEISRYVNDFLANTRVKTKSNMVPKKIISRIQTPQSYLNKCKNKNSSTDQTSNGLNNRSGSMEFPKVENIDPVEDEPELNKESTEFSEKHVGFQDMEENSEEAECWRIRRTRAPSLGVASAVPSFGKIASSFDSIDSHTLTNITNDDISSSNYLQIQKNFLQVPNHKIKTLKETENHLQAPEVKCHEISFYPHFRQYNVNAKLMPAELLTIKNLNSKKKSKPWRKQPIALLIKAVNRIRRGQKVKIEGDYKVSTISRETTSNLYENYNISNRHFDFTVDNGNVGEASTDTTDSSMSLYECARQRSMKTSLKREAKNNILPSGLMSNMEIERGNTLLQTTITSHEIQDTLPAIKKDKFSIFLNAMPLINTMYPRKKNDKCLACLDMSMKKHSKNENKHLKYHPNIKLSLQSNSQNVITDEMNIFYENEVTSPYYNSSKLELASNSKCVDYQTDSFDKNRYDDNTALTSDMYQYTNIRDDNIASKSNACFDRKIDQETNKKCIVSSKSFVSSTLSLASERSKTTSDQDDSDQALDGIGSVEDGIVKSSSKFLAPCHAPINLRPSLEPLKALYGKKTRSIQSRVASLEKTINDSCNEESDDNEISTTVGKFKDGNKNSILPKPKAKWITTSERTSVSNKFPYKNECAISNKITLRTYYAESAKTSSISDDIYSQLNMSTNVLDYNPSKSFQPVPAMISLSKIIDISTKSLNDEKNVIETLHVLVNEYAKHLTEKKFLNSNSNDSNMIRVKKITKRLLALLVDSKLYLNPENNPAHLEFSVPQKCPINSRQLRKVLPVKSYNLIAPILGIPQWHPKHWSAIKDAHKLKMATRTVTTSVEQKKAKGSSKIELITDLDLIVHPPSQRGSGSSRDSDKLRRRKSLNPYATFLNKPRRKAVIWRTLTQRDLEGYDPDATLKNRAAKITDTICSDFCQWLRGLGGYDTNVNDHVLENMFETDFDAEACKAMQVNIKEMPMIPTAVASIRNCSDADEVEIIRRLLLQDLRAKKKVEKVVGFGTALPQYLKYMPPQNHIQDNWLLCEDVPEDLETMDTVWRDITHLDSVKGFTEWLKIHSNVSILNQ